MDALIKVLRNLISNMNLTDFLAIWGAIISTILLFLKIKDHLQEKKRIQIEAGISYNQQGGKRALVIAVINSSKRTINILGIRIEFKKPLPDTILQDLGNLKCGIVESSKKALQIIPKDLPRILNESEEVQFAFAVDSFKSSLRSLYKIQAYDATSKRWAAKRKVIRKIQKEYEAIEPDSKPGTSLDKPAAKGE